MVRDGRIEHKFTGWYASFVTKPQANIFTCSALAALTLGVFWLEQSSGPESAVRRYLQALSHKDPNTMQGLITAPIDSQANIWLVQASEQIARSPYRVTAKRRDGNIALVKTDHEAQVLTPSGEQRMVVSFFWVLSRDHGVWRIDPVGTYRYRMQNMGSDL